MQKVAVVLLLLNTAMTSIMGMYCNIILLYCTRPSLTTLYQRSVLFNIEYKVKIVMMNDGLRTIRGKLGKP
jgi:hypothetical protein